MPCPITKGGDPGCHFEIAWTNTAPGATRNIAAGTITNAGTQGDANEPHECTDKHPGVARTNTGPDTTQDGANTTVTDAGACSAPKTTTVTGVATRTGPKNTSNGTADLSAIGCAITKGVEGCPPGGTAYRLANNQGAEADMTPRSGTTNGEEDEPVAHRTRAKCTKANVPPPPPLVAHRTRARLTSAKLILPAAVKQLANAVMDPQTGKLYEHRQLQRHQRFKPMWDKSFANKLGRLCQGIGESWSDKGTTKRVIGTNTFHIIAYHDIPPDR